MFNRSYDTGTVQMKQDDTVKLLEGNVKELQGQLAAAQKRIAELNDLCNKLNESNKKYQAQLSYYKSESI